MVGIKKWETLTDILALVIFGIVLFPNIINFVDSTIISVFWAIKNQEVDPVPALLADVYYTLNIHHEKREDRYTDAFLYCTKGSLYISIKTST